MHLSHWARHDVGPALHPAYRRWYRRLRIMVAALFLTVSHAATAQADRVDAGTFNITRNGEFVGREQFSLRRAPLPDGTAYELRSESSAGERRVAVQLSTDSMGSPIRYSLEIRGGTAVAVRAGGQRVRGRFATQVRRPAGESAREYLLVPGIVVLEPEFYHQLVFVVRARTLDAGTPVEVVALSLLDNTQHALRLDLEAAVDEVTIAGSRQPAARWRLLDEAGLVRMVWTDAEGRVLRVLVPSRSIEAVREAWPF